MQILLYILKRILQTIPLLIIVSIVSFFIIRLSPVDPLAELRLNPSVSKETLQRETERLGLDKPIIVQYGKWAKSFIKGDLGVTSNVKRRTCQCKAERTNSKYTFANGDCNIFDVGSRCAVRSCCGIKLENPV